jgi:hypothetical protein
LLLQVIRISNENGVTVLNDFGIIAAACWLAIPEHFLHEGRVLNKKPLKVSRLSGALPASVCKPNMSVRTVKSSDFARKSGDFRLHF